MYTRAFENRKKKMKSFSANFYTRSKQQKSLSLRRNTSKDTQSESIQQVLCITPKKRPADTIPRKQSKLSKSRETGPTYGSPGHPKPEFSRASPVSPTKPKPSLTKSPGTVAIPRPKDGKIVHPSTPDKIPKVSLKCKSPQKRVQELQHCIPHSPHSHTPCKSPHKRHTICTRVSRRFTPTHSPQSSISKSTPVSVTRSLTFSVTKPESGNMVHPGLTPNIPPIICQSPQNGVQKSHCTTHPPSQCETPQKTETRVTKRFAPLHSPQTSPESTLLKREKTPSLSSSTKNQPVSLSSPDRVRMRSTSKQHPSLTELPEPAKNVLPSGYSYIVLKYGEFRALHRCTSRSLFLYTIG